MNIGHFIDIERSVSMVLKGVNIDQRSLNDDNDRRERN